jgi:hypothetical protein
MTKHISSLSAIELVNGLLKRREMEEIQRYVSAGRVLGSINSSDLQTRWTTAIKKFWVVRSLENELELHNVSAELRLRNIKPPLASVREEFKTFEAAIERDYKEHHEQLTDRAAHKIEAFLKLLVYSSEY